MSRSEIPCHPDGDLIRQLRKPKSRNICSFGAVQVTDMELSFALELAPAHCEFASGTIVEAEKRLRSLSIRAVTTGERVAYAEYIVREQTGEPPPS